MPTRKRPLAIAAPALKHAPHGQGTGLIEGHIESVTSDAIVLGWVRDTADTAPCHIQVLHQRVPVAEATASLFRADLLASGHGHGHYGFAARLRKKLPPGPCNLALHLPRYGSSVPMGTTVPPLAAPPPWRVEDLLRSAPGWTTADLLAKPGCMDLAATHARMGTPRFIDGLFRFVLDRWPSPGEIKHVASSLAAGRLTPQMLLIDLLSSRERADMEPALPSPFDARFLFG